MGKKQMKWFLAVSVVLIAALLAATALIEQPGRADVQYAAGAEL